MRAWERDHPKHAQGGHRYALEDFGLTAGAINAAFESYNQQVITR